MANPNPKTDHLNRFPIRTGATEACAKNPVQVRIPKSQYDKWMKLPMELRNQVLREAIERTLAEKSALTA